MKYVYNFNEGNKNMKDLLGGKGANLAEMTNIGLPVPCGFTITTKACLKFYEEKEIITNEIKEEIFENIKKLELISNKKFGDINNPLLLSVRSGASISMPGMMDSVLNIGINDEIVANYEKTHEDCWFIYDSYRRLIQMYADVVMDLPKEDFEGLFDKIKKANNILNDTDFTLDDLKGIIDLYKQNYYKYTNTAFPQDPYIQLINTISSVFKSWNNERAVTYRKLNDIPSNLGTAVNVQMMVYGNKNKMSGTGVAFTRNPATGENKLYGEYLINAQGEDVVAGVRTPDKIDTLKDIMPDCYNEFVSIAKKLENHYKDMQDMEFTIEDNKLYMLQTRNGKRTTKAAIKIAVDMVSVGLITKEDAIMSIKPNDLEQLLHPIFDEEELNKSLMIAKGLPASPGAGTGRVYFNAIDAMNASKNGIKDIILVRNETSPEDIEGMHISQGILTVRGGMTSHAAVVARGMGACCISGCSSITIDEDSKTLISGDYVIHEGDYISLDGNTGCVYLGQIKTVDADISGDFKIFMSYVDEFKKLKVRTNADNERDALIARKFGAEGIGLCRTEHMFFEKERIFNFRRMILADTEEQRIDALEKILPYQRDDIEKLYLAMEGDPVIIRYLDPPLHEFLPKEKEEIANLATSLNMDFVSLKRRIDELKEVNPMMGHRGCRLAITYPEIIRMQTKAVIEASVNVLKQGISVTPEIMIPLVSDVKEFDYIKNIIDEEANLIMKYNNINLKYLVGTMIEVPRAALLADKIAKSAEFFSFGTNDLTQLTYGFSRDDAAKFLNDYYGKNILEKDPFKSIDEEGVGRLLYIAINKGHKVRPNMEMGICGEHGGEETSIKLCHELGLDYVSCSPYRIPIAKLAAAQAAISRKEK